MALFDYGGPQYGLSDGKIATWTGDGTYGTPVDIPSIQLLRVQVNTVNAELEGDDTITATASRVVSADVTFRFGSVKMDVLSVLLNQTKVESGVTPNRYSFVPVSSQNPTYFGICGSAKAEEGSGNTQLFVPKLKLMEGFQLSFEYNNFSIPEITCRAVYDTNFTDANGLPMLFYPMQYETAQTVTLPPYGIG